MLLTVALLMSAAPPEREYLTEVQSDVIEATGTAAEIASRGQACMSQILAGGTVSADIILSSDTERGVIVARNAQEYSEGFMGLLVWQMRSRMTLEAREGRFRVTHSQIERFNDQAGGWGPIGKWNTSGWQRAEAELRSTLATIANCIVAGTSARDDW